jgi:hypothetical protein
VRTKGGGPRENWLLLKHRDEWGGPIDIAEFAPLSVKCGGDFEDILADGEPAVWFSTRPARGGEAGAMFARIIERAVQMKTDRLEREKAASPAPRRASRRTAVPRRKPSRP